MNKIQARVWALCLTCNHRAKRPQELPLAPRKIFQRQQTKLAQQALPNMWTRHDMAKIVGQELGTGALLFRGLPQK
jgi:hypothetical protein